MLVLKSKYRQFNFQVHTTIMLFERESSNQNTDAKKNVNLVSFFSFTDFLSNGKVRLTYPKYNLHPISDRIHMLHGLHLLS